LERHTAKKSRAEKGSSELRGKTGTHGLRESHPRHNSRRWVSNKPKKTLVETRGKNHLKLRELIEKMVLASAFERDLRGSIHEGEQGNTDTTRERKRNGPS